MNNYEKDQSEPYNYGIRYAEDSSIDDTYLEGEKLISIEHIKRFLKKYSTPLPFKMELVRELTPEIITAICNYNSAVMELKMI